MERGPRGFQTAVDVEHGLRLLDCRMVEYSVKFSTTKTGRVITLEALYKGKFTWLYGNMIFMMFRRSLS